MMGALSFIAGVPILVATGLVFQPSELGALFLASSADNPDMACIVGDEVVVARLVNDELVLEVECARLSWLIRQKQEDGLFTFVALDAQAQGYPLGFAMVSFEDQMMVFAPPEAGLRPDQEDLNLVQCE